MIMVHSSTPLRNSTVFFFCYRETTDYAENWILLLYYLFWFKFIRFDKLRYDIDSKRPRTDGAAYCFSL